jgi:hypothetical protein
MLTPQPMAPGEGPHWERLAAWLRDQLPADEIDGIWVFRVLRRDRCDFGTAVLSRVDGERRRIYTASFVATVKGKLRGAFEPVLEEVGSGPLEALHEVFALVPERSADEEPPLPVEPERWFPAVPVEPPDDGG